MSEERVELLQSSNTEHRSSFFRQSGWMMVTSVGSGVLMSLLHVFSKFIPDSEYASFGALLQFLNWITIPAIGLQVTFAHQTSAVISGEGKRQLIGTLIAVLKGTFVIWLLIVGTCLIFQPKLISTLKLSNPASLWITLALGLCMLWLPVLQGLLQGRQNFLWLGWAAVFNSAGRILLAAFIVFVLGGWAAGMMMGALLGGLAALTVGFWNNRDLFRAERAPMHAQSWLRQVVPLSLGCGASQFLFSADLIAVQAHLPGTAPYVFGGTLARGLVLFTAPLVSVMFPKLVHSAAHKRESDLMLLTLILTSGLAAVAAIGLTVLSPFLIKFGAKQQYLSFVPLMPIFAWSMVPLAIGNVLLNNLMAHSRFRCVPFLVVLVIGYWFALEHFHDSFKTVIHVLGIFTTLFLLVCAFFTWGDRQFRESPVDDVTL